MRTIRDGPTAGVSAPTSKTRFKFKARDTTGRSPGYDVVDVRVSEGGRPHREDPARSEAPGTFTFTRGEDFEIWWYYSAFNETRTFTIEYRVVGAVIALLSGPAAREYFRAHHDRD